MDALAQSNPLVAAYRRLLAGSDPETVLLERDRALPTPIAWVRASFEALPWFEAHAPAVVADILDAMVAAAPLAPPKECAAWRASQRLEVLSPAQKQGWEALA